MTFGSGSNGCLGHGNFNDVTQVGLDDLITSMYLSIHRRSKMDYTVMAKSISTFGKYDQRSL